MEDTAKNLITYSDELQATINIQLDLFCNDWRHAVHLAGEALVEIEAAEPRYIEAMIKTITELGPYAVMAPGVALPHAGVNQGARSVGVSLTRLSTPVNFGNVEHDPVNLVIAFCTPDPKSHIEILQRIAIFLSDEERRELVRTAKTSVEVLKHFIGIEYTEAKLSLTEE